MRSLIQKHEFTLFVLAMILFPLTAALAAVVDCAAK